MAAPPTPFTTPPSGNFDTLYVRLLKADELIGDLTPVLPAALTSIANLTTTGDEMIYTTSTDTYATTAISGAGRSFVSLLTPSSQQVALELVPGVNVQTQSGILDNITAIPSTPDLLVYTVGGNYSGTSLTSFARTNIINAASSAALASTLGYIVGPVSTTNRLLKVDGADSVAETGISVDLSENITGINDLSVGGDIALTGSLDGINPTERAQLANINGTTISSTQWGYLGATDQGLSTSSTPTFAGISAGSQKVTSVLDPTNAQDAATKIYVDTVAATGTPPLNGVRLATAAVLPNTPGYASPAETLTATGSPGSLTIDGILAVVSDRILVKDQADDRENGIYVVTRTTGNWVLRRSTDFNEAATPLLAGSSVFVELVATATNSGSTWSLITAVNNLDPLTDSVTWIKIGGVASFVAGLGIDSTQLASAVIQTDISARLKYTSNTVDLNTVTVPYGGTGQVTLGSGNVLVGNGTGAVASSKAAPTGDFVGNSDSQTLTNKVMTSPNNNVIAKSLFTDSGANAVSTLAAANPTAGQVLTATAATTATWQTPSTIAFEPDRTLFVYQSAPNSSPNYSTLGAAITAASALTPTSSNLVSIQMYSGTYTESTPVSVPAYVSITGLTSIPNNVIIRPTAPAPVGAVMELDGNANVYGIVIDGSDGAGGYSDIGIHAKTSGSDIIDTITVKNVTDAGVKVTGTGTITSKILSAENVSVNLLAAITMVSGWEVEGGAILIANVCSTFSLFGLGTMTNGIYVHDQFSVGDLSNVNIVSATNGIRVGGATSASQNDFPNIRGVSVSLRSITGVGILLDSKSTIRADGISVQDNTATFPSQLHLQITNPALPSDPNLIVGSLNLRTDLVTFVGATNNPVQIRGNTLSETPGEIQTVFSGEVIVGRPDSGSQFAAGEGDHSARWMMVLKDDGGVFTNVTDELKSPVARSIDVGLATTGSINLASAPATIDGIAPTSGVTRILVKDGSTANPGASSVDNGIYTWNGTGAAMTRTTDFAAGDSYSFNTWFHVNDIGVPQGIINYGSVWKLSTNIIIATTAFSLIPYTTQPFPPSPVNDDAFYIGNSDSRIFEGIQLDMSTSMTNVAGTSVDSVVWEFWNGTIWTTLSLMSTGANSPYTERANITFEDDETHQYRFGKLDTWATTTVNGALGYWVRARVIDAANISRNGVVGHIKLHTNHTHIDSDGFVEYFGNSRITNSQNIPMSSGLQTGIAGITNPGSQELLVVDSGGIKISALGVNNLWASGVDTALTFIWNPPGNIDTSEYLNVKIPMSRSTGGAGDIALSVEYTFVVDEDIVKNPNGGTTAVGRTTGIVAYPTSTITRGAFFVTIPLDISALFSSISTIWFKLTRVGTDVLDTYNNDVYPHNIILTHTSWSNGKY